MPEQNPELEDKVARSKWWQKHLELIGWVVRPHVKNSKLPPYVTVSDVGPESWDDGAFISVVGLDARGAEVRFAMDYYLGDFLERVRDASKDQAGR